MSEEQPARNLNQSPITSQPTEVKSSNLTKYILFGLLGLALVSGAAYAGYWYGTQQTQQLGKPTTASRPTPKQTPTPTPMIEDQTKDWKTYISTKYDYSLKYPKDWFLNFDSPTNQQFSDIESSSPFDTKVRVDVNSASVEIFRGKYDAAVGTESEVALGVIEEKIANLTIDGEPAVKLIRTPSEGATSPAYIVRILVAKGNDVFEISSWGKSKEDQQRYNNIFNQILSTFKFISNETVSWKQYRNDIYEFEFKYPPDFKMNDNLPASYSNVVAASESLKLDSIKRDMQLTLWVNPAGFGPFFADKVLEVAYSENRGVYVTNEREEDISKYRDDGRVMIMISQTTVLQNHNLFLVFTYSKNGPNGEELFEKILSTFHLLD